MELQEKMNEQAYLKLDQERTQKLIDEIESSYLDVNYAIMANMEESEIIGKLNMHIMAIKNAGVALTKEEAEAYYARCETILSKIENKNVEKPQYYVNGTPVSRIRFPGHEEENPKTR